MDFRIKSEHRNPEYDIHPERPPQTRKKAALPLLMGILMVFGTTPSAAPLEAEKTTMGEPVYIPTIYTIDEMINRADQAIHFHMTVKMKHHVPLKLKSPDGKQIIEFIADGYNADKKLAYEWITAPGYAKDKNDADILSTKEISFISNSMFGDTMIFIINTNDADLVWDYVSARMITLKKSMNK
ncbi:MAG: hypothetical protein HPY53_05500 [Brevinematales bacterium]|nr:hypothetical protein [Brevinematales bacterium]